MSGAKLHEGKDARNPKMLGFFSDEVFGVNGIGIDEVIQNGVNR